MMMKSRNEAIEGAIHNAVKNAFATYRETEISFTEICDAMVKTFDTAFAEKKKAIAEAEGAMDHHDAYDYAAREVAEKAFSDARCAMEAAARAIDGCTDYSDAAGIYLSAFRNTSNVLYDSYITLYSLEETAHKEADHVVAENQQFREKQQAQWRKARKIKEDCRDVRSSYSNSKGELEK